LGFDNNGENGLKPGAGFKPAPAFMELTGAAKENAPDEIVAMISKREIIGYYHSRTGTVGPSI